MRTVVEVAEAVRRGELRAAEVLEECLARIDAANDRLNAFVHLDPELARRAAAAVDEKVSAGVDPGPLAGVPFGVKDLEDCEAMPTSRGSLVFKGTPPVPADSLHVARIRAAGGVPVGKTAAPEFGTVCFTSTRAWGTTRNPWNLEMTPGGSSGGSAAAVAGGLVPFCTASDGGGSTRIPASFSGLLGHKASFGLIPDPHSSFSQTSVVGALTTTVADAARHLDVTAGPDDHDKTSLPRRRISYEETVDALDVGGLRAIWSPDLGFAPVDADVAAIAEEAAVGLARQAGLTLVDRPVSLTDPVRVWLSSGAVDLWCTLDEQSYLSHAEELDRPAAMAFSATRGVTAPRIARAAARRAELEDEVAEIFGDADVLLTPTTAVPAFPAEGRMPRTIAGVDVEPAMAVPFTMLANLCWNPATSVPAGTTASGLPVGVQIVGRRHADEVTLRLARILEQSRPWPRHAPGWDGSSSLV